MDGVCALYRRKNQERNFRFSLSLFLSRSLVCSLSISFCLSPSFSAITHGGHVAASSSASCTTRRGALLPLSSPLLSNAFPGANMRGGLTEETTLSPSHVQRRNPARTSPPLPSSSSSSSFPFSSSSFSWYSSLSSSSSRHLRGCISAQGGRLLLIVGDGGVKS